jgi:hypothetical protein
MGVVRRWMYVRVNLLVEVARSTWRAPLKRAEISQRASRAFMIETEHFDRRA